MRRVRLLINKFKIIFWKSMELRDLHCILHRLRENIDVEFKASLTQGIFDMVCFFNDRNLGHILFGVNDKR